MKQISKILITGGPCAGKTTALESIKKIFSEKGYGIIFLHETATELISGGISPWTLDTNFEFQRAILNLQIAKEDIIEISAKTLKGFDKVLIILDRGTMDNKAYLSESDFYKLIKEYGFNEEELLNRYDAVFHLVTAAKGAEEFYTLSNNTARTESLESAIELDNKTINAWKNHHYYKIIDNSTSFDEKINRLINEISNFLETQTHLEIERKFLITYPNIETIENSLKCQKIEISQTYLNSNNSDEIRVRKSTIDNKTTFVKTIKRKINNQGFKRVEIESEITSDEYSKLLEDADITKHTLTKTRYCFNYKGQLFELDIYPFWTNQAILEIELLSENEKINFPNFIEIIREVTNDENYKNSNLAKK